MSYNSDNDNLYQLGKLMPQNIEVEETVLGTILINSNAFDIINQMLSSECFYVETHKIIFETFTELNKNLQKIDMLTVVEHLRKKEQLDKVGGAYFIATLANNVSSTANLEAHARIVFEKHMLRTIINLCQDCMNKAYSDTEDPFELLEKFQLELSKITARIRGAEIKHLSETGLETITQILERKTNPIEILGLPTGIAEIDRITCGLINSDLTIIAARPSHGKSTLGLQVALNVAKDKNVLFFSLEMTKEQLVLKTMSASINKSVNDIRMGKLNDAQMQQLSGEYFNQISECGLYLYDKPGISVFELVSVARQMTVSLGLDLIVVDYLQLLTAKDDKKSWGNREQEIATISKALKNLAKELNIPVIALSQLKRPEGGKKSLPRISDLRESGAIEQDADNVWLLCRPSFDKIESMELNGQDILITETTAILDVAKDRMGDVGILFLDFYGASSKFVSRENYNSMPQTSNGYLINHRSDLFEDDNDNPF